MSLNGQLDIKLKLNQQDSRYYITQLDISLSRPNLAQQVIIGQSPKMALERISHLMSVCQQAQTTAAKLALGDSVSHDDIRAVQYENIEQLFWRLVIDLAPHFAIDMPLSHFSKLTQATRKAAKQKVIQKVKQAEDTASIYQLAASFFQQLSRVSPQEFLSFKQSDFQQWLAKSNAPISQCLRAIISKEATKELVKSKLIPPVPTKALLKEIATAITANDTFIHTPTLAQQACETGSFSNIQSHPLVEYFSEMGIAGRFAARLLDLAKQIELLNDQACLANNSLCGVLTCNEVNQSNKRIAWLQTARGLLIHMANLQGNKISQYSILAPTEWNFHPQGSLEKALVNTHYPCEQSAIDAAKLVTIALDPCIEFTLQSTNLGVAYA